MWYIELPYSHCMYIHCVTYVALHFQLNVSSLLDYKKPMGNESSRLKLKGITTYKNVVQENDFWTLYNGEWPSPSEAEGHCQLLSIFEEKTFVSGGLWADGPGPLERAIKNFMVYRHPYIMRYVATWEQSGLKFLATERVSPLNDVLLQQSNIQICLGLRAILCSLIFLVETALGRHFNICTNSVYVSVSGSWRLAGFSYVWTAKDINKRLLEFIPLLMGTNNNGENFEQFAFATMCEEIFEKIRSDETDVPYVHEFREYCRAHLKHQNSQLRPKLSAVLLHPYFNHEFAVIHSFLFELPLKSVQERHTFFLNLVERLRCFEEKMVASLLANDLLSRMVLLDSTAQQHVTPYVLRTKTLDRATPLFTPQTYVQYLLPHILKMFRLRDGQIRLILLDFFTEYICLLSEDQLQREILPHLQLGMNDTNEVLVAKTIRCMADLVPIMGATKVLGGERRRYFSDGRPNAAVPIKNTKEILEPRSITPLMNINFVDADDKEFMVSGSPLPSDNNHTLLPLRLSPDGGEDDHEKINLNDKSFETTFKPNSETNFINFPIEHETTKLDFGEEDVWSDWENTDAAPNLQATSCTTSQVAKEYFTDHQLRSIVSKESNFSATQMDPKNMDDLSALDIQVQSKDQSECLSEVDYFKDMEPVIHRTERDRQFSDSIKIDSSRFAAVPLFTGLDIDNTDVGWGHNLPDEDMDFNVTGTP
ncbi:protein-associating with the carboxyl-terminal domain of ezrin isoform X2 [Drosophila bipectinata]|uniref:protein-associating with the carboxyl-terminal domain of ezrin isoform X2 n=2 Tax=Drosophila bipectinata TaxID=42026 RepID=UPI001C8A9D9E|nr:protein-associating with the carboxyl-terminal domain of ezrin isoform X1 [Drosophila bipectinata]